jgi:glycosyltransferase involved in cell wall biosynthesis
VIRSFLKDLLRDTEGYVLARAAWTGMRRGVADIRRVDRRSATLEPEGEPKGNVLLAFIVRGLLEDPVPSTHTQFWETLAMARAWRDLIDNYNFDFSPRRRYDFLVAARMILERLAARVDDDCVKILHIDTAHWLFHATAEHQRMLEAQERRGTTFTRLYPVERNRAIEAADCATMLGNDFTRSTYAYAEKPIWPVPISTVTTFPFPERRDIETARRHYVWFGSRAPIHKGLDLVLEAFAGMPDHRLTVVGPVGKDTEFTDAFAEELGAPNVTVTGWVDMTSGAFEEIARSAIGLVYPSCSEGQSGAVVACLHAGLIPVVSRSSGVDVSPLIGRVLEESTVEEIRRTVAGLSELPVADLERMARGAWVYARANHTRQAFAERYREAITEIESLYPPGGSRRQAP